MLPEKLEEGLIEILKNQIGSLDIKPETELHRVYTDSLDRVEVILEIEREYGLELPDDFEKNLEGYAAKRRTNRPNVKDMADYLRETNPVKPSSFGIAAAESLKELLRR